MDSRPASPDPTPPSALEQNQASAPGPQPLTSSAPAPATTSVTTPAPVQASQLDRFTLRSDVLVKMSTDEEGETTFLYKRKTSSVLMPATPKVSTAILVDTAETLLRIPAINSEETPESFRLDRMSGLSIPEDYFFLLVGEDKSLDPSSLLERAQNHKGNQQKKLVPPAFPVRLMGSRAPHNLTELLWRDPYDKSVPYQLRELDQTYWAAESSARQDLAHHLATTATASLLKEWLSRLSHNFEAFSGEQLEDILTGFSTVAEGLAHMVAHPLQGAARKCAETRLAARSASAKDLSGPTLRGILSADPCSTPLFNAEATSSIIAAQPPIINISAPTPKARQTPQRFPSKNPLASTRTPAQANHRQPFPSRNSSGPKARHPQSSKARQVPYRPKPKPQ
ncbi:hypothetical protein Pmani_006986 [Petrolisthes manimaculis]|uniref:Uncharacterized protein n=1 Tax=Petrolisthes manimaculis TaxID=1843537 RepID=A0AAE1UFZ4_9EUCA|nr:hypothetical protein Pmani_006986 [Petrolisthes manimaculis]